MYCLLVASIQSKFVLVPFFYHNLYLHNYNIYNLILFLSAKKKLHTYKSTLVIYCLFYVHCKYIYYIFLKCSSFVLFYVLVIILRSYVALPRPTCYIIIIVLIRIYCTSINIILFLLISEEFSKIPFDNGPATPAQFFETSHPLFL